MSAAPPVETALDDVRACEVAGYGMAVDTLRDWLALPDAEMPGSETRAKIEEFRAVTTGMYYQKVRQRAVEEQLGPIARKFCKSEVPVSAS